jgi:hypothetical protein
MWYVITEEEYCEKVLGIETEDWKGKKNGN